jgi:hypothetical protein
VRDAVPDSVIVTEGDGVPDEDAVPLFVTDNVPVVVQLAVLLAVPD